MGFAFEPYQTDMERLTTSIQLNHPNDNAENFRLGAEFAWNNTLFLRAGFKRTFGQPIFCDDGTNAEDYTAGVGFFAPVAFMNVNVDYSFAHFNRLGYAHRISMSVGE